MREEWTDFFSQESLVLSQNYPGLGLQRFLLEVQDILVLKTHPQLSLDQSKYNVTPAVRSGLESFFIRGIPFSYLTKFTEFYGRKFFVDERVLIPRPETEYMVDLIVQSQKKYLSACDVGTGSGVILLSLIAEGVVQYGLGVDISSDALTIAGINAHNLRLDKKSEFFQSDRLTSVKKKFDLIVSNPPYIKEKLHRSLVHQKVDEFEPALALYLPDEEYDSWFMGFFQQVLNYLNPGGLFFMEGHENELQKNLKFLVQLGFKNAQVLKDLNGIDRFLSATI